MSSKTFTALAIMSALFLLVSSGFAYMGHGKHAHGRYHWNPDAIITVSGEVTKVETTTMRCCGSNYHGVHLYLKTKDGELEVHLGPKEFVNEEITIKNGDQLTVKGSKSEYNDTTVIFAATVTKDGKKVTLRNDDGIPVWAGKGKHHMRNR